MKICPLLNKRFNWHESNVIFSGQICLIHFNALILGLMTSIWKTLTLSLFTPAFYLLCYETYYYPWRSLCLSMKSEAFNIVPSVVHKAYLAVMSGNGVRHARGNACFIEVEVFVSSLCRCKIVGLWHAIWTLRHSCI